MQPSRRARALLALGALALTPALHGAPPANDACEAATLITTPSGLEVKSGTLQEASRDGSATCGSSVLSPDVWYAFPGKPGIGGRLTVTTCGSNDTGGIDLGIDTVLALYTACAGVQLDCNDDWLSGDSTVAHACAGLDTGFPRDSAVSTLLAPATGVVIRVSVYGGSAPGPFTLRVTFDPHVLCCRGATCGAVATGACVSFDPGVTAISVASCDQSMAPLGCCYADFNHSGFVSIDDLFLFLNGWFHQSPYADVGGDGSGTPTIDDLFLYFNMWFTGCG